MEWDRMEAQARMLYDIRGGRPIEGKTVWVVQYLDGTEYREVDGSRTTDLKEAIKHRDRLRGKGDPGLGGRWKRPQFRVREVDKEPPLPW
jgi:hypothetical protein